MGLLGVEELETSSIYIVDEENQKAECWYAIKDIREENKRLVSDEMTLILSDTWVGNEMWKFYRSKKEQASIVMKGDNRKEWINYCADKSKVLQGYYGNEIPERTYHLVKFNGGYMGAASPGDISSESWDLLKRASAVFSLAYTRFKDLQDAEASAREAQIEAALERVRSRTMGMQKSEELKDVIRVVYEQFVHLKINVDHAGFVVDYTPKGDWHFWIADEHDIPSKITHPYFESVWANQFNEAKEKGADFFATNLNFEEKNKFYNELLTYVPGLPEASKDFYLSCPALAATTVLFDNVSLYIENFSGIPYTDEENKILMRFGKVFQQTYTRFLDLQKAEAQARESQIEASLERLRAKSMSMQQSDELHEVLTVLCEQFDILGILPMSTHMTILDIENNKFTFRETGKFGNRSFGEHTFALDAMDTWKDMVESWRNSEPFTINRLHFPKENLPQVWEVFHESFASMPEESRITPDDYPDGIYHTAGKHPFGYIGMNQVRPATTEEEQIVIKFANEFGRAYQRFLDLQKAEAQAREAQIEAALERVRSKALAMYNTNDLSQTVSTFFKELKSLNVLPWRCGVGQINEKTKTTFLTTTSNTINGESFEVSGTLQQEGHPVLDGIFEHWKMQKEYYPVLHGDDIRKYYEIIKPQIAYPKYPLDAVQYGHFIFVKEGFVFAWTENKLSEEELGIFRRFASVLSLTYRRYLDLKEAEERNRIIQAENDRKTKELEEARQLQLSMLPKKLPQLPNLEIAVYMKTATEVGGDYYDFNVDGNGTLTFVVGDATGHGMMSGMMVSIMKSFFISNKANIELKQFFENSNNSIKDMQLGRLMMGLIGIQITSEKIIATNAGMPSLLYFRNKSQKAGEFVSNNLPLGGMKGTQYLLKEINYEKGDTLLLMSDGFAELKNSQSEQYGYTRAKEQFRSISHKSANEIIEELKNTALQWLNGAEPDDDVTFVVIKVK